VTRRVTRGVVPKANLKECVFGTPARAIFDGAAPLTQGGVATALRISRIWPA
jgi:hypothetical protein